MIQYLYINLKERYTMNLYEVLDKLNIKYKEIEHKPVFTVKQAQFIKGSIDGIGCKNLFLTNKKGNYYLVVLEENKNANIKEIKRLLKESHLSFASIEELKEILNLEQGSVTPLGIINDAFNKVMILIDNSLKDKTLLFHPNINTKTISISYNDLIKYIEYENHNYKIM